MRISVWNINAQQLRQEFDAVLLTGGSAVPRDLGIPGRDLKAFTSRCSSAQNNRRANGMDLKGEEIPRQRQNTWW